MDECINGFTDECVKRFIYECIHEAREVCACIFVGLHMPNGYVYVHA